MRYSYRYDWEAKKMIAFQKEALYHDTGRMECLFMTEEKSVILYRKG
jgi:hypothetical protein